MSVNFVGATGRSPLHFWQHW